MEEQSARCRVCWRDQKVRNSVPVYTKWTTQSTKTIKEIILLCVPWMTIENKNYICKPCLWQLKYTYDFIDRCLKTENILNEENNKEKFTLEEIFEQSLKKGNQIKIIFENNEDTNALNVQSVSAVDLDEEEYTKNIDVTVKTIDDSKIPSEHDYCLKKGNQLQVNIERKNQKTSTEANTSEPPNDEATKNLSETELTDKENLFDNDDDDNVSDHGSDIFFTEPVAKKETDGNESTILPLKSRKRKRPHNILREEQISEPKEPSKELVSDPLYKELKDVFDIAPVDMLFVTTHADMAADQQADLVSAGINILNMSKDPSKKKRVIYFGREYFGSQYTCVPCKVSFFSRCDHLDHLRLHKRGKIATPGVPIHTCEKCSETFAYDIDFRAHTRKHHGISAPHRCKKCNRRFRGYNEWNEHVKLFKNQEKCGYMCTRCKKLFSQKRSLEYHEEDVKDAPCCNYKKCRVCYQKFTPADFMKHCKEVHSSYLCQECGKSFPSSASLCAHKNCVHNPVLSMCHECGKILNHPKTLEHHMQSVHGEHKFMCDKCSRQFTTKGYLDKHTKNIHVDQDKKKWWKCEKCGNAYTTRNSLQLHEKMFHLNETRFMCPICNDGFLRKDYLNRHLRQHARFAQNSCKICKRSYATDGRLEHHMFYGHDENGKSLEPSYKPIRNLTAADGKKVKKKYNTKPVLCVCKICQKVLLGKPSLQAHYMAHLNIRKYKCEKCGISLQTPVALTNHLKKHDNPDFQFSCNICHAYKSSDFELQSHMMEVHKEKKYKCKYCQEAFGRKHLLYDHETMVHPEVNAKKEMLLKMLTDQIEKPKPEQMAYKGVRGNKGTKMSTLTVVDIDKVLTEMIGNNESAPAPLESNVIVEPYLGGGSQGYLTAAQESMIIDNLNNSDYQKSELAQACQILVEDNKNNDIYISYQN